MKRINRLLCWITGVWRTLRTGGLWAIGATVDGCDYIEEIHDTPAMVQVLRCEICGKYDIGWRPLSRAEMKNLIEHGLEETV